MTTRRTMLTQTLKATAAWAVSRSSGAFAASIQQPAQPQAATPAGKQDEMTVNTTPHPQAFSHYDFGPVPAVLPPEANAVRGRHSLKKHAQRHGLMAGAAVVVRILQIDPALQKLVAEQY